MRTRVLRAGGMNTATTDSPERFTVANRSYPHARLSGPLRGLGPIQLLETSATNWAATPRRPAALPSERQR